MEFQKDDQGLVSESVDYAARYMSKMKGIAVFEQNLVANGSAHGFYMGAKFAESRKGSVFWWTRGTTDAAIAYHSRKAANFYIKNKVQGMNGDQLHLVRFALVKGFTEGAKSRAAAAQ